MSVRVIHGDCSRVLKDQPDASVQCCVTSPPYFGLRDYGIDGQIGLEPTPDEYIVRLVAVFREVRRVLRDDGVLFLNLGDSYATQPGKGSNTPQTKHPTNTYPVNAPHRMRSVHAAHCDRGDYKGVCKYGEDDICPALNSDVKPKDLIGIPWMAAFALRADGWWLRSDIIWHKPNPMPESVTDRPTSAHEHVFLLTKSARYFWDADAVAEPSVYPGDNRALRSDTRKAFEPLCLDGGSRARTGKPTGETRNIRNVWTITPKPFRGAHFATFPPELAELCIKAGSKPGDTILDPFGGAGTTGLVADRLGRDAVLIELNPEYTVMAQARVVDDAPLFAEATE